MDIVKQLRQIRDEDDWKIIVQECLDAADEIERLRGLLDKHINEKAKLKQAMIDILEYLSAVQIAEVNIKHIARKALGEIPEQKDNE